MKKVYIDNIKSKVNLSNQNDYLAYLLTYQDGSTFVTRESDKASLWIKTVNNKVIKLPSSVNYLGHLEFPTGVMHDYLEAGTYLAEIVFDYKGTQAIYPHGSYLEVVVN